VTAEQRDVYPLGGVRLLLKEQCERFGGIRKWGRAHKISAPYVSRVISGQKVPAKKLLDALGLEPSTVYVRKQRKAKS
jgi:hypothetical protein